MLERIKSFFRSIFQKKYHIKFANNIPELLEKRVVYVIDEQTKWVMVFSCPCGCEDKIHLNLLEEVSPKWAYTISRRKVIGITPSVNRVRGCKSHFWLRNGKVHFV